MVDCNAAVIELDNATMACSALRVPAGKGNAGPALKCRIQKCLCFFEF